MNKLDVRLIRLIKNTKGQFISITVVVIVALSIFVAFNMTAVNLSNTVDYYYEITNFGDIFVQLVKIPHDDINKLKSIDGVEMVQGRISFDVPLRVEDEGEKVRVRIISVPDRGEQINSLYMLEGRNAGRELKSAVVIEQFAKARNIKVGDKIRPFINGKVHNLDVVGIAASSEYVYLMENEQSLLPAYEKFGVLYVSEGFAQSVSGFSGSYNEVLIKVGDGVKIDEIVELLEDELDRYGVKRIIKREDQLSNRMLAEEVSQLKKMSAVVPLLFLIVASIIIFVMISRMVKNDRIYIGILKALGYDNLQIMLHYIKYSLFIGFIGAVIGIILGILLSGVLASVYIEYFNIPLLKLDIYYIYMVYAIILTGLFSAASGLFGARPVLNIMPADSMRPEYPKSGKRIFLEKISFIWDRLTFSWKMIIRNIFRNKKRFAIYILGIAVTYAITLVPAFEFNAFSSMFELQYGEFQRMGYIVDFAKPMDCRALNDIKHMIDVNIIEPKLEYPFELRNGWLKKVASIVGVPKDTVFYDFRGTSGEKIKLPESGIFVTEGLARSLNLKKGDKVLIKNFIPERDDVAVEVKGIVRQYLGINGYMNIDEMQRLLVEKGIITGVNFSSDDAVEIKLKAIKNISTVQSIESLKEGVKEYLDAVIFAIFFLLIFGGILGFAIVYNTTIMGISERSMEFSSLRVLGFDKKDIFWMVTRENFIMAVLGIVVGVPLGKLMCEGMAQTFNTDIYTIPVILTPQSYMMTGIAVMFFVMVAQLATWRKIYSLNFIDALKNRIS
ncbi:MAG: FtsX-like permease family protein [Firmicutes bacterium]|nr:FtsX-like permease family protein [Bacillota bacterium]